MKKIIVVCVGITTGNEIANQIRSIMGESVKVEAIPLFQVSGSDLSCDLVLFTSKYAEESVRKYFDKKTPYAIAKRVINHKNIKDVISLPSGSEVLLVNDGEDATFQTIGQLIEIGLDHVKYYPFYPECEGYPKKQIAITPGEPNFAPDCVDRIIDIGTRILDIKTIYEIQAKLQMKEAIQESIIIGYIKDIVEISKSIDANKKSAIESRTLLETILNSVEYGIVYVSEFENIISVNSAFESMIGKKRKNLLSKKLSEVVDSFPAPLKENDSFFTTISGREVLVDIEKISFQKNHGYLLTMNYIQDILRLDQKIRKNNEKKIKRKLYTFDDYLSVSKEVRDMLEMAKKSSKTEKTILIQGENGTGKEILAQSIHMNSYRKSKAFVPVNIAAIAPNLLESELFGYEKGSFTGASSEGKTGLFEMSDGGTLFIDEIGDAPLDFQVKLLRVLEEKRIRRVGALEEIPVNVRVIAATNQNLIRLIDEGKFREDLFFRLNILQLQTKPLRTLRNDIPYLLRHFIGIFFSRRAADSLEDIFEKDALDFLTGYRWRGNMRELINLVEYLSVMYSGKKIGIPDLPHHMNQDLPHGPRVILGGDELWILRQISYGGNGGTGRKALSQSARSQGLDIGEGKIRRILSQLADKGLISNSSSNRGCTVSEKGLGILETYKVIG